MYIEKTLSNMFSDYNSNRILQNSTHKKMFVTPDN